jgi:hypothetical protein
MMSSCDWSGLIHACVHHEVLLSVCQVLPSKCACDFVHLLYSECVAAAKLPHTSLHFCTAPLCGHGLRSSLVAARAAPLSALA